MLNRRVLAYVDRQLWLNPVADLVGDLVHGAYRAMGTAAQPVKDFLNGTWLGHPLHPVLTDFTLGAWMSSTVLDSLAPLGDEKRLDEGSQALLAAGIASTLATATAGLTDWIHVRSTARRVGIMHAALNTASVWLFGASILLRRQGRRPEGRAVALAGLAAASAAAYLGGEMAYTLKIGVNHAPDVSALPQEFTPVMRYEELPEGTLKRVEVQGIPLLLVRRGPEIHGLAATCAHLGGPLDKGSLRGDTVVCPWHGSTYSLTDGRALTGPSARSQPALEARVVNGMIEVRARQGLR
ncbi:MAG: Rieske 2Fe-2S domain-containing protein [Anaerolineae bacterium]|jgi:nitrite reductase/ring-hydroxylating ferredoxin subunit/uncharacterized membrane protein